MGLIHGPDRVISNTWASQAGFGRLSIDEVSVRRRTDDAQCPCWNQGLGACLSSSSRMGNTKENAMYIGIGTVLLIILLVFVFR